MSSLATQPQNQNFLSPFGFRFHIKKTPHVNYFVQSVTLPGITIDPAIVGTPFVAIPFAGDHIQFTPLTIQFKVDEDLKNYLEIYNWMIGIGFPDNFDQYKDIDLIRRGRNTGNQKTMSGEGIYSDLSLTILSSSNNPLHNVLFEDATPVSLSELQFATTDTDVNYLTASTTFAFRKYSITPV